MRSDSLFSTIVMSYARKGRKGGREECLAKSAMGAWIREPLLSLHGAELYCWLQAA